MVVGVVYVLDASSVMNLYATRRMADILTCLESRICIADIVLAESQYILTGGDGEEAQEPETVDLSDQIEQGTLQVSALENEDEMLAYIDLASRLDDGEAMTIALALIRGWVVVTEDRKAERVLETMNIPCVSSIELIKQWADRENLDRQSLRSLLLDVRLRAKWEPRRGHPHRHWWDSMFA